MDSELFIEIDWVFPRLPFGIVAYAFVGKPLSKQLYTYTDACVTSCYQTVGKQRL